MKLLIFKSQCSAFRTRSHLAFCTVFDHLEHCVYAKVEPCCSLKLCWIFGVHQTQFTAVEELLNLLLRDLLFTHNTNNFA